MSQSSYPRLPQAQTAKAQGTSTATSDFRLSFLLEPTDNFVELCHAEDIFAYTDRVDLEGKTDTLTLPLPALIVVSTLVHLFTFSI